MYPPTPLEPLETNSIYESTIVVHDPRPISQCSFGPRNIQITSIWKMFLSRSRTRKREDNFQPFWKSLNRALTRDLRGERNATTVELFSSQKGGRCVFSARRFVSIRTTTLFVELLRGSPPLLGAELFFLTAWDGITWEFFHDLRVLHGEICVGFFSLSLFLLPFFFFSFLRNPPHRKISSFDLDARTPTFHFSRVQFQETQLSRRINDFSTALKVGQFLVLCIVFSDCTLYVDVRF